MAKPYFEEKIFSNKLLNIILAVRVCEKLLPRGG
jgi:hypothetical protein